MNIALGTVQLGLPYGASNRTGMPSAEEATEIVRYAVEQGITSLDTAHGYEKSQERLGVALKQLADAGLRAPSVVTKLDTTVRKAESAEECAAVVDASIENSKKTLGLSPLPVVCLHFWGMDGPSLHGGAAWERLKHHKAQGAVTRVGTSLYSPDELIEALRDAETEHVQLPFNLLDYRWREAGVAELLAARPDVTVHTRSCFLQGILTAVDELGQI